MVFFRTRQILKQIFLYKSDFGTEYLQQLRFWNENFETRTILWKTDLLQNLT